MKKIIYTYFVIINFLSFNLFAQINKPENKVLKSNNIEINLDYLKQIPENDYIIGPGDELQILVSREYPELNSSSLVDGEGTIYVPRLKRIFVEGLTINELTNLLNKSFKTFVKYPEVEVTLKNYRPINVTVSGEVQRPGFFSLEGSYGFNDIKNIKAGRKINAFPTLFDAIRAAEGLTAESDLRKVSLIREDSITNGGGLKKTTLDFSDFLENGQTNKNIRIYDGDNITVAKLKKGEKNLFSSKSLVSSLNQKTISVFINGRIKDPGELTLNNASVLNDAILIAGGPKALKGKVRFIRIKNDGTLDKRTFNLALNSKRGSFKNPYLRNNDIIYLKDSLITTSSEVISEFTAPITGIFSTYGLIKAIAD